MFYDRPDCIVLSSHVDEYGTNSGIFLFKNILPADIIADIEKELAEHDKSEFKYEDTLVPWYANKLAPVPTRLHELWEFISEILGPEYVIHPSQNLLAVRPGDNGMFVHSDSPGKGCDHMLSQDDVWTTCCSIDFGLVGYLGDFTGGALFYPNINADGTVMQGDRVPEVFEYYPQKGDVVLHSAFEPYSHGVREVESGVRYAFSNFVLKAEDNPETFYNYGSPEYIAQIGDKGPERIREWMLPLKGNPRFTPEKLKEMKDSGLVGEELSKAFLQ